MGGGSEETGQGRELGQVMTELRLSRGLVGEVIIRLSGGLLPLG